jgi:hypothetical protein
MLLITLSIEAGAFHGVHYQFRTVPQWTEVSMQAWGGYVRVGL